jgi:hypothetical protein
LLFAWGESPEASSTAGERDITILDEGRTAMGPTKQATSASMALVYITIGALTDVWTFVYYIYLQRHGGASDVVYLWIAGFFFSGLVLLIIGFAVGRIGRAARQAEVTSALPTEQPPVVTTAPGTAPAGAVPPTGQVVVPVQMPAPAGTMPAPPATTARR